MATSPIYYFAPTTTASNAASSTTNGPVTVSEKSNDNLSIAAKAGIGAGVGIVALLAIVLLMFYILRRRRRKRVKSRYVPGTTDDDDKGHAAAKKLSREGISEEIPTTAMYPKPELEGSQGTSSFTGAGKPELSATASVMRGTYSCPTDRDQIRLAAQRPGDDTSQTWTDESRNENDKQIAPAEKTLPILPQLSQAPDSAGRSSPSRSCPPLISRSPRVLQSPREELSPKYLAGDDGAVRVVGREYLSGPASSTTQDHKLIAGQAQEHAPSHNAVTIDVLKAEHAALAERIRQVEMREHQRDRGSALQTHDTGVSAT